MSFEQIILSVIFGVVLGVFIKHYLDRMRICNLCGKTYSFDFVYCTIDGTKLKPKKIN